MKTACKIKATSALAVTLAAGAIAAAGGAGAQEMTLRVADSFPTTHYVPRVATEPWMNKVEELTDGKVAFEYYPAEQLGKSKDLLSLTQTGVTDIGYVAPSYVSDKLPLAAVAELPESFRSSCEGTRALWEIAQPGGLLDKAEFEPNDVQALFVLVLAPYQFFTKGRPIEGLESFEGMKVRTTGGAKEITAQKIGAIPVQIPAPETREAISRGTIDALLFPNSSIPPYGLSNQVDYATKGANFGAYVVSYMISRARWAELPEDVRQAMTEAGEHAMSVGCEAVDRLDKEDADKIAAEGVTYVELSQADQKKLDELLSSVGQEWAAGLDSRGMPGTEVLEAFRAGLAGAQ